MANLLSSMPRRKVEVGLRLHSYRLRQSTSRQPAATTGAEQNQANDESIDPETGEITTG